MPPIANSTAGLFLVVVGHLAVANNVPSIPEVTLPALLIVPVAIGLALLVLMQRSRARARKRRPPQ
jgi:hypothetical protein